MITPRFSCSQTDESIIVTIYCPSVRASEVDIHVDETLLTVHINPYFLRLNFSHNLLEDEDSSANYDPGSGSLTISLTKENKGENFKDLDLLAKLLAPRPSQVQNHPVVEVIGSEDNNSDDEDLANRTRHLNIDHQNFIDAAESDWQLPQDVPEPLPTLNLHAEKRYGFLDMHSGYFTHVSHTENEVNELGPNAEVCTLSERRRLRLKHEDEKWDEEHYMADYADDEYIQDLLRWQHPHILGNGEILYTEEENMAMLRLPRKEYLASVSQTHNLYLTLLTLLFSYSYDARSTQHDPSTESAWTICVLTPAFAALDPPPYVSSPNILPLPTHQLEFELPEIASVLTHSYRRAMAFPLYRSFAFAEACRSDIAELLLKGKRTVVRCLLEMKDVLDHHDIYHVYSKIWVDDFCVWAQAYASDGILSQLADSLQRLNIERSEIGWDLEELEAATRHVQERESDSDDD